MKKIISLIVCLVLVMSFGITAGAAGAASINSGTAAVSGGNVEFTVNVSGCSNASSVAVAVSFDSAFELVSGTWLKTGSISKFDTAANKGALGGLSSPDINGNLFKLVLKAKTASADSKSVSINVIAKNGSNEIMNVTPSKSVKISCATHSWGSYSKKDNSNHIHTCSVCGTVESKAHNWNSGAVTKAASCKETGLKTFTCNSCGAVKTETIAKTNNHTYSAWSKTKAPTCTAKGTETRTCSICQKKETRDIAATGHSMGSWVTTKEATCEAKGQQTRSCSKCSLHEVKEIKALGHSFTNPTVTKQPTCTETGIETGKCTRCGKETTNTVKATGHKFGKWEEVTAASCTKGGEQIKKCSECGASESRKTEALGHDFENPTVVKEATIGTPGLKEGKCKRCGEVTSEVIPCTATDKATGTVFEAEKGVFGESTELKINEVSSGDASFEVAKNALKDVSGEFKLYDINAMLNGTEVQPNGKIKASFKVPDGFGDGIGLYYIADDGSVELIEAAVSEDGKTLTAQLDKLGNYAICRLDTGEGDSSDPVAVDEEKTDGENAFPYIIIAIAAVVVIAGIITVIVIKKRK